ncbi:MAG: thioredoxin-disulfide reductase [Acidobacteria bacterium]|jgi:thioredoxin reductase (NADPH)|nr:thioredoxin-disulfide reductase [Acidobacteriota bacterium]
MEKRNVIIIGSGPAGLTAAIYTARANLKPLLFEGSRSGGQLMITTEIENFPGFSTGITGPELMQEQRAQAERFGAELLAEEVTGVELTGEKKIIWADDQAYEAETVIIATGARTKLLGLPNEIRLMGRGVSACATCDGFFFKDKVIAVIGGGDSTMEEATFLTRFASKVYIIHRRDQFRASKIMVNKAKENPKIEFIMNMKVKDILGQERVTGLQLENTITGEISEMEVSGVFVAIGHQPDTHLFNGQLKLDHNGYILTSENKCQLTATSVPGVFACGDVQDPYYRQAITAAGSGCMAALDAEKYLDDPRHHYVIR